MENDQIRALILRRMREKNVSAAALSRKIGKNLAYINQFLKRGIPLKLPEDLRYAVAVALDIQEEEIRSESKKILNRPLANDMEEIQFGPDMIPVLGNANGSDDAIILNFDQEIGRTLRHPNQANVKHAFAVIVYGDSMAERYCSGEKAFVAGNIPPTKGQDCLIEMNDGTAFVKRFLRKTDKEIICEQLNPAKEWHRPIKDVKTLHSIVGRG